MVSLTIDGKDVQVAKGTTILEAAAKLGITIPTLCWLEKVSPTGACRVCAVEIEGVDRTMTACNTPVKEGIRVTTQSERLTSIRRKVMELMLVNHPLDCPVCDAGGECDLQNACYGLGATKQEFTALLERRKIRYDWPLIESDPNRCILCEKCVKVDHEIVGADAIKVVGQGEATIIDTVDGQPLSCEFCGNCIAACPTGTLISKPFKFRGRPWAFKTTKSVCAFCAVGCQIEYHSRNNRVERVTSEDSTYNTGNLCIHGRFGYSYLNSPERLTAPLIKEGGSQVKTDWDRAMAAAAGKLQEIITKSGPDAVAGIGSPRVTNEENYLFQKLFRTVIGTGNIDSEARFGYAVAQEVLLEKMGLFGASNTLDRIDTAEAILVFGCDLNAESTGTEYRVIKAATKNDAKLVLANMRDVKLRKYANSHLKYRPGSELHLINALTRLILETGLEDKEFVGANVKNLDDLQASLKKIDIAEAVAVTGIPESDLREAAALIGGKKSVAVLFGADLMRSSGAGDKVVGLVNLALVLGAVGKERGGLFPIHDKANMQGLLDMGVASNLLPGGEAPSKAGKDLWQIIDAMEKGEIKALYLVGSDPLVTFPANGRIRKALEKLELLIVQDVFATESAKLAHVVFPAAAAAEKTGSFTTTDNRLQCLGKAVDAPGDAREDWDIITELSKNLTKESQPHSTAAVLAEIKEVAKNYGGECSLVEGRCVGTSKAPFVFKGPVAVTPVAASAVSSSPYTLLVGAIGFHNGSSTTFSVNNLEVAPEGFIEVFPSDASKLGISDGGKIKLTSPAASIIGTVKVSPRVQPGLLFAPSHFRDLNANSLLEGSANIVSVTAEKA